MYPYMIGTAQTGNYAPAFAAAREAVSGRDPLEIAKSASVVYDAEGGLFHFDSLTERISVKLPECDVVFAGTGELPILEWRLMALHYLQTADGAALSDELRHFRDMPGGNAYEPAFINRSVNILVSRVCGKPVENIKKTCVALGATLQDGIADVQALFWLFPRFPVTVQIWAGDEEFEGAANILFNARAARYLPTEDMAVAASVVARFIMKQYAILFPAQ